MYMYQYYLARFRQYGDQLDTMFLIWVRTMAAQTQTGHITDTEKIKEILSLVDAYRAVKGGVAE